MQISGKYLKVWEVEHSEKYSKVNLGEGVKDKDGNWENFTWFGCVCVGNARLVAETLSEGDKVEIKSGMITKRKGKDGKFYDNIVIFEMENMDDSFPL